MRKTKIDWCDSTVNPVVGCTNGCPYCYARKINDRFNFVNEWSEPRFFPERLKRFRCRKPQSVFIDSMSDIGCWEFEWFGKTMDAVRDNPQHRYIALTKNPERLLRLRNIYYSAQRTLLKGIFFGATLTSEADLTSRESYLRHMDFLSIEPLLAPIKHLRLTLQYGNVQAVIIGAETGNRKYKVIPEKRWVDEIVGLANEFGQAVFMKESLRPIMGDDFRQDRLPWEVDP